MSTIELRPAFRQRFRAVTRQVWSLHVGRGVARTAVAATALLAAFAAVDYVFELPWLARVALLAAGTAVIAVLAVRWIVRPALAWNRARVAAEFEGLFPRLGQRLRTATQYGGRPTGELVRDGVSPSLVDALEQETAEKVKPLPLRAALPVRSTLVASAASVCCLVLFTAPALRDPEWRTALRRVALAAVPYTSLSASPSALLVDEGGDVQIRATLSGRARPVVVLHSREAGELDWRQETMEPADDGFTARLSKLRMTTEFFVAAGPDSTPVQQVFVRRLLKFVGTQVKVTPPAYTGVSPATYESGSFSAIRGSTARIRFQFDRLPAAATLVGKDPAQSTARARRIEMAVQDAYASAELLLDADVEYTVEARDAEGVPAVANRHRVRVIADQPPTVRFDEPPENLEVHTLAEVRIRARARDDFGITKIGIVFQVNNEEERTLVLQEVGQPFQREVQAEQVLMLEQFLLTQKDCVAYYAFAEDNRPGAPQRSMSELRFIDIRPFLRTYRLVDEGGGGGVGRQRDLIFLDEVIARQRFNLNQTMRLETRSKARLDLAQVESVAAFENQLATQTHTLADFLASLGVDGAAVLSQAEEAMLSAVDSLHGAKFATAIAQERDALRYLMEARNTAQQALARQSGAVRAQARAFDRLQRQKLRRPNDKAEALRQIAEELARLADEEDEVARLLSSRGSNPTGADGAEPGAAAQPQPSATAPGKPDATNPMAKQPGRDRRNAAKDGKGREEDPAQEQQDDIAARATAVEKVAATVKGLTSLAKTRITDAAQAANAGADALGEQQWLNARKEIDRARELFRLAAKQVAALAAEEAAQQIAAARDIANDIALQAAPADFWKAPGAGTSEADKKMPSLVNASEQAKTLKDVLELIAGSESETAADLAQRIAGLLQQENLAAAIARLEKPSTQDDRAERQDLADRFGALSRRLDEIYRETIAPRLEELARLEREANELECRADAIADEADWRRLRQQGAAFVERLEAAGLDSVINEDLRGGLGSGPFVSVRPLFRRGIAFAHARLVAKLQEFMAGDRFAAGNEAVPPEYKDLVDQYLRALSAGSTK
jgi:hypothetical protein